MLEVKKVCARYRAELGIEMEIGMELGIERIAEWMRSNRLRLNPEKTDFLRTSCGVRPAEDGVCILTPLS